MIAGREVVCAQFERARRTDLARIQVESRRKAAAACDAKQWSVCLPELDEAGAVDPDGDDASTVKRLRDRATVGRLERR